MESQNSMHGKPNYSSSWNIHIWKFICRMKSHNQVMMKAMNQEHIDPENLALIAWEKQGKKRQFDRSSDSDLDRRPRKRDLSKVECYTCDKYGHISRDFPERAKRHHAATANEEEVQPQKKLDPHEFLF